MQVTKQQIVNGIIKYSKSEMIPKIADKTFKIILSAATSMIEINPEIITRFLDDPTISLMLMESEGTYDIDAISGVLEKTLEEYGTFPIKVPGIKFISPEEKELNFGISDIKTLKSYITGGTL